MKNLVVNPGNLAREIIKVHVPNEKGPFKWILTVPLEEVYWFEGCGFKCANGMVAIEWQNDLRRDGCFSSCLVKRKNALDDQKGMFDFGVRSHLHRYRRWMLLEPEYG